MLDGLRGARVDLPLEPQQAPEETPDNAVARDLTAVLTPLQVRSLLTLVRKHIRQLERRAQLPAQRAKVAALLAAGRNDATAWTLDQLHGVEDRLCQALAAEGPPPGNAAA